MHLTDTQLLEPDVADQQHLHECANCQTRLNILSQSRETLASASSISATNESWELIKQAHFERSNNVEWLKEKRQSRNWRISSLALAASLLIALVWNVSIYQNNNLVEQQNIILAQLMEDNRILQQKYNQFVEISHRERDEIIQWQLTLRDIDTALQRSYLNQSNEPEKIALWKKRQQFIQHILSTSKDFNTLKI